MLKNVYLQKSLAYIDCELKLLSLKIEYPSQFQQRKAKFLLSPLYLSEETNLIEIMEMVSGVFLSKRIVTRNGIPIPLTVISRAFEELFNIKLGDIHKKHESVISRKPSKATEFLDTLRKAIQEERKNKGYL